MTEKAPTGDIWYENVAIGRDKLNNFLQDSETGITEKKTNHSLHVANLGICTLHCQSA